MAKGGQGLPLETIVLAAIAVLVLVIIVLFATGSFGKLLGSQNVLAAQVTPDQLSSFKIGCEQACFQVQQISKNANDFKASGYCSKTLQSMHCWSANVSVTCSVTFATSTGGTQTCNEDSGKCDCV